MTPPRATLRLQFHRDFTFADAAALVPYFASLGISHLYASPILTARPGSVHGYDVTDATRVNSELGGEDGLRRFVQELRRCGLGLIVDIVPNHMAIGSRNAWWMDVLAHGRDSRYARYFDIDWTGPASRRRGKVLLPILGRPYGDALAAGEITLRLNAEQQPVVRYFEHELPLAGEDGTALDLPALADFDPSGAGGRKRLHRLLERQHYRLAWWRCANDEINWRRFFDINELAAIRVEDHEVFEAVHAVIFRLYAEGLVDGVRVDHIDGLSRPADYCRRLRARLHALNGDRPAGCPAGPAYVVVEKILAHDEELPTNWETDGTTGYDFMDEVSALQHDGSGAAPLTELWERISGRSGDFGVEEALGRREILQRSFSSQLEAALDTLCAIAQADSGTRDISRPALRRCLTEILVRFPVYRLYAQVGQSSDCDREFMVRAVSRAIASSLAGDAWLIELLGRWLLGERIRPAADALQAVALTRFQQLSAPLSAKAVEDTAFYRYGRLISRNDVGFDPGRLACSRAEFHERMQARAARQPHAMLATATHDHKRGEDVRARLAVLSEIPEEWSAALQRWMAVSADLARADGDAAVFGAADRTMLFQTIVGAWPMGLSLTDRPGLDRFAARLCAWQQKALREAKLRSDWLAPNEPYERLAQHFVRRLFAPPSALLAEVADFAARIAPAGAVNSLGQSLLKLTAPGVPDIFQGTEYWDFSLVDPDNRTPVDFVARQQSVASTDITELTDRWQDGRIKQFLAARVLATRKNVPKLFADGDYMPLQTEGPCAAHMVAFARVHGASMAVTAISRHPARLLQRNKHSIAIAKDRWDKTRILLPQELRATAFEDVLAGTVTDRNRASIEASEILCKLPVALMLGRLA